MTINRRKSQLRSCKPDRVSPFSFPLVELSIADRCDVIIAFQVSRVMLFDKLSTFVRLIKRELDTETVIFC